MAVPVLITPRLTLRPVTPADALAIVAGVGDWDVAKWLAVVPHPYTLDDARQFIEIIAPQAVGLWAIDDGDLAGIISIDGELGYWLARDRSGEFPHDFHAAMAEAGFLGICMPEAVGGSGLGVASAAILMQAVAQSGAGMSGASAIHMNIFGPMPVVSHGTQAQQARMLPPLISGAQKACFAVTEPDAGLDTTAIATFWT
jgi:alkylation response protein AidB-like acyl-CoA dehydrogenase